MNTTRDEYAVPNYAGANAPHAAHADNIKLKRPARMVRMAAETLASNNQEISIGSLMARTKYKSIGSVYAGIHQLKKNGLWKWKLESTCDARRHVPDEQARPEAGTLSRMARRLLAAQDELVACGNPVTAGSVIKAAGLKRNGKAWQAINEIKAIGKWLPRPCDGRTQQNNRPAEATNRRIDNFFIKASDTPKMNGSHEQPKPEPAASNTILVDYMRLVVELYGLQYRVPPSLASKIERALTALILE